MTTSFPEYDVLEERYSAIRLVVVSKAVSTIRTVLLQLKFTECNNELQQNALSSMNRTVAGMLILVRAVDPNAELPTVRRELGETNVTTSREAHK